MRPFRGFNHHTVTSINHLFLFSSETWDAALNSLSLSVLVMVFASFSDSFKYFHTADTFAAVVRASIWSRHVIVRYNLFGLFAYSAEHRKSFFCYFRPNNFGCRTFGASLVFFSFCLLSVLSRVLLSPFLFQFCFIFSRLSSSHPLVSS